MSVIPDQTSPDGEGTPEWAPGAAGGHSGGVISPLKVEFVTTYTVPSEQWEKWRELSATLQAAGLAMAPALQWFGEAMHNAQEAYLRAVGVDLVTVELAAECRAWRRERGLEPNGRQRKALYRMQRDAARACGVLYAPWAELEA